LTSTDWSTFNAKQAQLNGTGKSAIVKKWFIRYSYQN
jgi:hypothetical protein